MKTEKERKPTNETDASENFPNGSDIQIHSPKVLSTRCFQCSGREMGTKLLPVNIFR